MRNLQECQAEVFRRSEQRIKERKKRRKHLLMLCIPLVLCLTTVSGLLLSGFGLSKSTDEAIPESIPELYYDGSATYPAVDVFSGSVAVSGNGLSHLYAAEEKVQGITDLIDKVVNTMQVTTATGALFSESTQVGPTAPEEDPKANTYQILIRHGSGTVAEYSLSGAFLTDHATHQTYPIPEDTYTALKALLELPFN